MLPTSPAPLIVGGRPGPRFATRLGHGDGVAGTDLDGDLLDGLVDAVAAQRRTSNRAVAASLWMSQYASWTVAPVLAELTRGHLLDASLDATSLTSHDGVVTAVSFGTPPRPASGDPARDDEEVLVGLVDRNLAVVLDRLRARVRISSRTLWGDVAAAFATGTRVLSWCAPPGEPLAHPAAAAELARRLLFRRGLDRLCSLAETATPGRSWLVVHRATCCLAYQTPTGGYCATCSLLDPDVRAARLHDTVLDHLRETR